MQGLLHIFRLVHVVPSTNTFCIQRQCIYNLFILQHYQFMKNDRKVENQQEKSYVEKNPAKSSPDLSS
jgi:hypothetical protein